MSTILLWQFDKFLQKHNIGAYSKEMVNEFRTMQQQHHDQLEEDKRKEKEELEMAMEEQ